ncbi:patatin-like phospholipase [Nitritalea halalkaliphila LW7]|uniref:Patatin-like phospholipase n=1 Tax=Nitritalea halalkaliphila LW7 TaxID=1189621 RepID=I5C939_9BACT|nr:patatin-like phospholipase family protein [Nitritalea halalkaliphila]EIM78341.1 patatin-like phospholipase [Nitritalea halalkaliphila LW7]
MVIRKGYLHDALRASIAIPTAFTAFRTDSTLLVDGGVVNNFPVDVVREMGAEVVIGSNVGDDDFKDLEGLGSFSEILLQLAMARSYEKLEAHIRDCDVYVSPDLSGFGTASFNRFDGILARGREAAEAEREAFTALAERLGVSGEELPDRGLSLSELRIRKANFRAIPYLTLPYWKASSTCRCVAL